MQLEMNSFECDSIQIDIMMIYSLNRHRAGSFYEPTLCICVQRVILVLYTVTFEQCIYCGVTPPESLI